MANNPKHGPEAIHVLQVDDDMDLLKVSKNLLEMFGDFIIQTATSVDEALSKIASEHYDVIVSDYQMPQKDGLEFLQELKNRDTGIPFIVFTGKGREEVAAKALNLGAFRYLNKSGETEAVYSELAAAIRQAKEQKRLTNAIQEKIELNQILIDAFPCLPSIEC